MAEQGAISVKNCAAHELVFFQTFTREQQGWRCQRLYFRRQQGPCGGLRCIEGSVHRTKPSELKLPDALRGHNLGFGVGRASLPQLLGDRYRRDLHVGAPGFFVAVPMQILVMSTAERHRELVADLASQGSRLGDLKVVRVRGCLFANQTRLPSHEREVCLASLADRLLGKARAAVASSVAPWTDASACGPPSESGQS
jgi:hypothetical protein